MDPCRVEHIKGLAVEDLFHWKPYLHEGYGRDIYERGEEKLSEDFSSSRKLLGQGFDPVDQPLGFSGTKSRDKLEDAVHMLVVHQKIQVNSHIINNLDVDFFQAVRKSGLVDQLLHGIKVEGQRLILGVDGTPQVEDLSHGVLLETRQGDGLLEHHLGVLVKSLRVVAHTEELGHLGCSPDDKGFFLLSSCLRLLRRSWVVILA